jgi:hypothetical protein
VVQKHIYTVTQTTNLGWDSPDDSAVVRAVACEGGAMPAGVSACAACRKLTAKVPHLPLSKRIDRARETLDVLKSVEALLDDHDIPDDIVQRHHKSKTHYTKLATRELQLEKLRQKLAGGSEIFQSEMFVVRRKLALAHMANYNKPELKASDQVRDFYSAATKDGFSNANVKHFVQQFAAGNISEDNALVGMIVSWAQIDKKMQGGVATARGIKHMESTFNFLLGLSRYGRAVLRHVTKSLIGHVISRQYLSAKLASTFGAGSFVEIIDPSPEQMKQTAELITRWFGDQAHSLLNVHLDATKIVPLAQWDARQGLPDIARHVIG